MQPEIVLAIWGIETNFGGYMGGTNTVHALATLAHAGYRAGFFGDELITSLEILEAGHVTPKKMVGSWAGAMGHPQFMPSSFMKYAVDFKGEGHKDIWSSVPDALASTANYLKSLRLARRRNLGLRGLAAARLQLRQRLERRFSAR